MYVRVRHASGMSIRTCARACVRVHSMDNPRFLTPLRDRDVADEDAIMSVEEGDGESAVPCIPAPISIRVYTAILPD